MLCTDVVPGVGGAVQLLESSGSTSRDKLSQLKKKIADLVGTSLDNVDIITLRDVAGSPGSVDVTYAAHGSPYYMPVKLDTLVWMNRENVIKCYFYLSVYYYYYYLKYLFINCIPFCCLILNPYAYLKYAYGLRINQLNLAVVEI